MVGECIKTQQSNGVVLRQPIESQLVCWCPNSAIGGLQSIEQQARAVPLPRFPCQSGLQVNWATQRNSHMFNENPPIPAVPDWDQLDTAAIEADCYPSEPLPDDPVFDFSDDILEDLSVEDKWMLLPPSARWAVAELPKQLWKPDRDKKTDRKKSERAQKFNGVHDKCRSKHWQNMQSLAGPASKPVPCAKSSKRQKGQKH